MTQHQAKQHSQQLGSYQLRQQIARGNMGTVYEGYDISGDRPVALKISHASEQNNKELALRYIEMFMREARIAAMLHHPNILEVFDNGIDSGRHYIVFELVKSARTLKDWLADNRASVQQSTAWILQCLRGLQYAHRKGVIHRDIKPANLLLTTENKIKIADFSIAFVNQSDQEMTMPTGFVGSPRYMSPEQVQEDIITAQSDLYSLGVVFYELLTGVHPFEAKSFSRLIYKLVNEAPIDPRELNQEIPAPIAECVMKMLAKEPTQRFASASDIINLLVEQSPTESAVDQKADALVEEQLLELSALAFFQAWDETELREIRPYFQWYESASGLVIHSESTNAFSIILDGEINVKQHVECIYHADRGESFCENLCLPEGGQSLFYETQSYVRSITILTEHFLLLSEALRFKIYRQIAQTLAQRLLMRSR